MKAFEDKVYHIFALFHNKWALVTAGSMNDSMKEIVEAEDKR